MYHDPAHLHRIVEGTVAVSAVMNRRAPGIYRKRGGEHSLDVAHAAVRHAAHASGGVQELGHPVAHDALVIGARAYRSYNPYGGNAAPAHLVHLPVERSAVGGLAGVAVTRRTAVQLAGERDADGRFEGWRERADRTSHVILVRGCRIDISDRICQKGGIEFTQLFNDCSQ